MTRRREFLLLAGALACTRSWAQPSTGHRIGFLLAEPEAGQAHRLETLRDALRQLGYVEGKNIAIEVRSANGAYERLADLASELVHARVEVIVAFGTKALTAAAASTSAIPIVIPSMSIRADSALAAAGNIVGSDNLNREIYAKRVELLKESFPAISRIALLVNPAQPITAAAESSIAAAKRLNIEVQVIEVHAPGELSAAFVAMKRQGARAFIVSQDTMFSARAREIAELAMSNRLPSAGTKEYAEAGGLIGYGASDEELYRRAAHFIDRLLKGAKPKDLPVERAMKLELVLNMRAAKSMGASFPPAVLLRADKVIE